MTDDTTEPRFPDPSSKARGKPSGRPVQSGGHTWLIADVGLARLATRARDSLFNDIVIGGDVAMRDVKEIALIGLGANYEMTVPEMIAVIEAAETGELASAIVASVFVHEYRDEDRSYTNWARSAMIANGIDPAKVAKPDMPHVLRQLVATGRAMELSEFTSAGEFASMRADLLSLV